MEKSACLRQGKPFSCMTPPDSPSGDIPHADGPFTPIPPQAHPFTSSGASTAAAMFLHGTPGRTTTALSGRRASAADTMPHALGRVRPLPGPTAPGLLTKATLPVSTTGKTATLIPRKAGDRLNPFLFRERKAVPALSQQPDQRKGIFPLAVGLLAAGEKNPRAEHAGLVIGI